MDPDFFNDPIGPMDEDSSNNTYAQEELTSKLKRTACVLCRKRKLKCDAGRPKCATCARLGHTCEYNEVRKKSGPKRGYVKALEARLSQVETRLKTGNAQDEPADPIVSSYPTDLSGYHTQNRTSSDASTTPFQADFPDRPALHPFGSRSDSSVQQITAPQGSLPTPPKEQSWEMISLGLEEPLPTQDVQDELFEIYFRKIHPTSPMIHKARFYSALNYAPHARPPVALRYAMWTLAAGASDTYTDLAQHFYRRARKYVELDEIKSFGEAVMSLWHCQTAILLSVYEFKNMHFPRAWLNTGRAIRLAQMLGLHRIDGFGLEVKQCLPPAADWTEKEERKRTFWMTFSGDRCASIGTGWPMTIDEQDIKTELPASEAAFQNCQAEATPTLEEALRGNVSTLSPQAGAIIITALFGRNLLHLHRPGNDEREHDLNGAYWQRHRSIDQILLNINLNLPDHLRIPAGLPDPACIFMHLAIHTSVICLHQAAIFKIDRNHLPTNAGQESKIRCVTAAAEIANIMRSTAHCDLGMLNPFSAFCLYVASRVFVQYLKSRPSDQQVLGSLHFLLSVMHAFKRKVPLAESFLAQLDVDLEAAGITTSFESSIDSLRKKGWPPQNRRAMQPSNDEPERYPPANHWGPKVDMAGSLPNGEPWTGQHMPGSQGPKAYCMSPWDGKESMQTISKARPPSRHASVEEMEMTPPTNGSYSTPSNQTHDAGSTGRTSMTSPQNEDASGSQARSQSSYFHADGLGAVFDGLADTQPSGFIAFKDYNGSGLGGDAPSSMTPDEFDMLTKNYIPTTTGDVADSWSAGMTTGLTPGPGEDWNQILEGMTGWEASHGQDNGNVQWVAGQQF